MRCHRNVFLIQDVFNPSIHRKINVRLIESYYNSNYDFLKTNPLPKEYLADIDQLLTENENDESEHQSEFDSETEIYFQPDIDEKVSSDESIKVLDTDTELAYIEEREQNILDNIADAQVSEIIIRTRPGRGVKRPKKYLTVTKILETIQSSIKTRVLTTVGQTKHCSGM